MCRFSPVFTDNAVLQQKKPLRFWGTCIPGHSLRILLFSDTGDVSDEATSIPASCLIDHTVLPQESTFRCELPALNAGGPYRLLLFSDNQIVQSLRNIMIGEVWLAGGQSNMEFELQNDADAAALFSSAAGNIAVSGQLKGSVASQEPSSAVAEPFSANPSPSDSLPSAISVPEVRFYQVPRQAYQGDTFTATLEQSHWMTTRDNGFGTWSAVAYHFAQELSEKCSCCVGIIGCNWGGTSASAWQDSDSLLASPETAIYWEEYQQILSSRSEEEYEKERLEYFDYQENWQPKINQFYADHPTGTWEEALAYAGPCKWPGPMGSKHEFRPAGLYETMLRQVTPYSMQGFLYYQGESDDHHPASYHTLLKNMICVWRREFCDDSLYFLNVQLPMHQYASDPVSDSWAVIRQAQARLCQEDPRYGLAVIIDRGEYNNIHPTHKKEVGHRLCLQALYKTYRMLTEEDACVPALDTISVSEKNHLLTLKFRFTKSGFDRERYDCVLAAHDDTQPNTLVAFEVADSSGTFYPADALFKTGDTEITLQLPPGLANPTAVRYLWNNYSLVPLFDLSGSPAAPFSFSLN